MLRFAAHPVHAYSTGLPCSTNWFSLFPPEISLFDQTNSLFRGVGNSKLKPHDISGLGGFDPAYSRPNPRNSLFFPCKTGKSGQRRVRSRLRPPPTFSLLRPSNSVDQRIPFPAVLPQQWHKGAPFALMLSETFRGVFYDTQDLGWPVVEWNYQTAAFSQLL